MSGSNSNRVGGSGADKAFPCVKLRGLPFDVSDDSVVNFLGCDPLDILLVKRDGRFSGEAFIILSTPRQVEAVLAKDKSYIGRRYIEIFAAKKLDYYKAVLNGMADGLVTRPNGSAASITTASRVRQPAEDSTVLRLRGLPFSTQAEDVVSFFEDVASISPENIHLVTDNGRPMGIAYMEFTSATDAAHAMSKDRQMMGNRYIEIFTSSPQEMIRSMKTCGMLPNVQARAHTNSTGARVLVVARSAGNLSGKPNGPGGNRRRWYNEQNASQSTKRVIT